MKINIFFDIQDGSRGGANQFLRALRNEFDQRGIYETDPLKADVVILNSYHKLDEIFSFMITKPEAILIHRLGPVFHYHRGKAWKLYDWFIIRFANALTDGIIFQSEWSHKEAKTLGLKKSTKTTIIHNTADGSIFNQGKAKAYPDTNRRFRLITSSNSDNREKGSDYFEFLDKHLDFTKYEMTFVGRSKSEFTNIKYIPPQEPKKLAELLKSADAYVSPVRNEACSNAILEAFACRLPVIALDDSSNPEIVGTAGELFRDIPTLIERIEQVRNNYDQYIKAIKIQTMTGVAGQYTKFINRLAENSAKRRSIIKIQSYNLIHQIIRWIVLALNRIMSDNR
jgi:glycosyltransferase involved in cell wall biosynthesis